MIEVIPTILSDIAHLLTIEPFNYFTALALMVGVVGLIIKIFKGGK